MSMEPSRMFTGRTVNYTTGSVAILTLVVEFQPIMSLFLPVAVPGTAEFAPSTKLGLCLQTSTLPIVVISVVRYALLMPKRVVLYTNRSLDR